MHRLSAIKLPLAEGVYLLITPSNESAPEAGMQPLDFLPAGWQGKPGPPNSPILYDPTASKNGMHSLGLVEVASFHWEVQIAAPGLTAEELSLSSSLSTSLVRSQWNERLTGGRLHGDFRFTIYLGAAWLELTRKGQPFGSRIFFEVITEKIGYAIEYRSMVESIGRRCSQLLLDWGSPTTLNISPDPEKQGQTLLEKFLFLRHVLGPNRLDLYLETLSRRPHSTLNRERVWQPAGYGSSSGLGRDPLRFGRHWQTTTDGSNMLDGYTPREILHERKYDAHNTAPNRFIKFALQTFRSVCEDVINSRITNPKTGQTLILRRERGAAWQEAVQMRDTLDAFLASPFFAEIGHLRRIPFESQTLQKRQGYREILHAWLMLEVAAQINWPGRNDAYDGTNRDVATLYEFWLYFVLIDIFKKQLGMIWLKDDSAAGESALPFCCKSTDGGMRINLKRGSASFCRFLWTYKKQSLLIHFFYNRAFQQQPAVLEDGSYSKGFRPDYTVVVVPGEYKGKRWRQAEALAEASGTISYLHFDAKYRIDRLKELFSVSVESDADRLESKSTGSVKNADLYKMHTYNEAIRRTVGSYVLYPGADLRAVYQDEGADRNVFRRYHEIVPGIGAFAIKPKASDDSHDAEGVKSLGCFFEDFLIHQLSKFTQSHRVGFWTHQTLRDDPKDYAPAMPDFHFPSKPPKDTQILMGFVRNEQGAALCRKQEVFFCHAVEWHASKPGTPAAPADLDFDPFRSDLFVAYAQKTSATWIATVKNVRLVAASERAKEQGLPIESMKAAYYYRFQLSNVQPIAPRDVSALVVRRPGKPLAKMLNEFAACPILPT